MKFIFYLLISIFLVFNNAFAEQKLNEEGLSPEIKGIIGGGGVTGLGALTFGLSIAGVTAIFPLTLMGSGVGYLSVKANKKYKNLNSKKKQK